MERNLQGNRDAEGSFMEAEAPTDEGLVDMLSVAKAEEVSMILEAAGKTATEAFDIYQIGEELQEINPEVYQELLDMMKLEAPEEVEEEVEEETQEVKDVPTTVSPYMSKMPEGMLNGQRVIKIKL
tara:strand:- start:47 stop:424 length:378 start_codon:yes stop_codon:yes gene_type:complete